MIAFIIILILILFMLSKTYGTYNEHYVTTPIPINQYGDEPIEDIYWNRKLMDFYAKYGYYPFLSLLPYVYPEYDKYYKLWTSQSRRDLYIPNDF